ncbi:MAG: serine/threonine protein kinase [Candidatus Magnetoglobus multicellularis str. Araruama]|uniref:non-specific serine/threonine protein kinase n=1 Tax=Candidatus Magnetoglobus multicellularis str. Araruama TaxID=890399 RepID=A0A1V1NWC0_9BACT|nr:MAG: serine/threonine protein kinase [Candidatus Magnetoglobus multicellularis str. Araruama]
MVINGFRIDSIIGEGGMGQVYLAIHEKINKRMAVKSLSPHLITKREEFKRRFYDEAKIQALLEHPNIIQITNFIEQDSNFYLFMEYVEGESLEDLINRKKRLSDDEAIRIIIDVLKGLQHAHELGVIHRDIKPSNIMITRDGIAKIMDFGIAMMLEDVQVAKGSAGTIQYMSPEQISQPKNINHRSDIYSIGIVLYQLLTGRIPFKGKTEEIKRGHIFTAPPPIQESIYSELNTIVMKAMSKDSDDRFNDCKTFIQTLEEYLNKTHMECPHKKV